MQVLAQLPNLQNLTLKGCPLAEQQGYPDNVREQLSQLHIIDSQRLSMSGKTKMQPGKAGHSAADVSLPGKGGSLPSANPDTAPDKGGSIGRGEGAQPKPARRSEHPDTSHKQLAGPQTSGQAPKRKRSDSASVTPETAAGRPQLPSKEPGKKLKMAVSAAGPATGAVPSAQAEPRAASTMLTVKAKAKSKQAAQATLQASGASARMPTAKLVEHKQVLEPNGSSKLPQHSCAKSSGRGGTGTDAKPVAKLNSSKQCEAAPTAPKQKLAKATSKAKQPANGSHAFATGKEVMHLSSCDSYALNSLGGIGAHRVVLERK